MKRELFFFLPLHSEDKRYEVRWLFKTTNATWATSRGGRKVPRSACECGAVHTLVWRQLWDEPVAAAPDGDEGSSSLDSFCSSLWRPRLMWLCRAAGVNHSLGRQLCRKGMHELKYASLLTQRGISRPHSNWENSQYVTWGIDVLICCWRIETSIPAVPHNFTTSFVIVLIERKWEPASKYSLKRCSDAARADIIQMTSTELYLQTLESSLQIRRRHYITVLLNSSPFKLTSVSKLWCSRIFFVWLIYSCYSALFCIL